MRYFLLLLLAAPFLSAQDSLPHLPSDPAYHASTIELAEVCLGHKLYRKAKQIAATANSADGTSEVTEKAGDKPNEYSSAGWKAYLDKRENIQKLRALGAFKASGARAALAIDPDCEPANKASGKLWLDGFGWLRKAEHERLSPLHMKLADAPKKQEGKATWDRPWVIQTAHFGIITDLPYKRALKYAALLDKFYGFYFETVTVVAQRTQPNLVYISKTSANYVNLGKQLGFPQSANASGLHIGMLGCVLINAERADYVGKKNRSKDNRARTLFHECCHRLTEIGTRGRLSASEAYKHMNTTEHAWIVEGVAIIFEDLRFSGSKAKLKGLEDQRTYTIDKFWKSKEGKYPSFSVLIKQGHFHFAGQTPVNSLEKYAFAGSVGWLCLFEKPVDYRAAFLALLMDYYIGDTKHKDFNTRFGISVQDFEKEWLAFVKKL
ncbi:MAG: hypothetical protein ACYTDT_13020 [Planctomycetota bacterium]